MILFRASALLLAALALVSAHDFTTCKNQRGDPLGVKSVIFTPDPPKSGRPVTVSVKGTPSIELPDGKLHVDIRVLGITVNSQVLELCEILKCPLKAGEEYSGEVSQDIPEGTPDKMGATVRITVLRKSGEAVSCLESKVEISNGGDKQLLGQVGPVESFQRDVKFLFEKWKKQHPKAAANLLVFSDNLAKIVAHNRKQDKTFTMAMNEFGSMTEEEFVKTRMGFREPGEDLIKLGKRFVQYLRNDVARADPPKDVDWTTKGVVAPVKNQGSCGSCWAFAAVGAMESGYAIKTGKLVEFSEQMLVSCDDTDYGCQGGWMDNAYDWVQKTGNGICTEADYPYSSGMSSARGECLAGQCTRVPESAPKGFVDIPANEAAIAAAVAQFGPVSVGIQADQAAFQFYHSGVLTGTCGTHLNHGVLIVGYGVDQATGTPFWKVKNSWGAGWGEEGYVRIQRGKRWPIGGQCGIASHASYPIY